MEVVVGPVEASSVRAFAAYARRVLAAEGPGAAVPSDAARVFRDTVAEALAVHAPWPAVRAIWTARLARAAPWFLEGEAERRARGVPVAREVKGRLEIPGLARPFAVTARADRIDRMPAGVAIYDYKSGSNPTEKEAKDIARLEDFPGGHEIAGDADEKIGQVLLRREGAGGVVDERREGDGDTDGPFHGPFPAEFASPGVVVLPQCVVGLTGLVRPRRAKGEGTQQFAGKELLEQDCAELTSGLQFRRAPRQAPNTRPGDPLDSVAALARQLGE